MLTERLKDSIRARGPIPFRDWMEAALYDPAAGYYKRSDLKRWGREADYRTSSERSVLFAATFARYFAKLYDELQRPPRWMIVEGGAGNGRFAAGVLRSLSEEFPCVFDATRYSPDDISPDALARAHEALAPFQDHLAQDRSNPWVYFSNELLDAFPVHRVDSSGELYVTLDADNNFAWTSGPFSTARLTEFIDRHSIELAPGQIIEINLAIDYWLASLKADYVITVDYGAEAAELYDPSLRPAGTLRAFSAHGFVDDVLSAPGEYDITSSVNWTQVKATGEKYGFRVVEFASQDKFLLEAGLLEELELRLARAATDGEKLVLSTDAREMILPGGMASSFQVLVQKRG